MRILVLDEDFPWPLNTGKRLRSYHLLCRLAAKHDMRYVAYGIKSSGASVILAKEQMGPVAVERKIPAKSGFSFYFRLLWNLFSRQPYIVQSLTSRDYAKEVERQVTEFRPDVVISEGIFYSKYFDINWRCKKVVATHNIESEIWRRYMENESNFLKQLYIWVQYKKIYRFERQAMKRVDAAIAVSAADSRHLYEMNSGVTVETVANGVDLDYFKSRQCRESFGKQHLVFIGSMDWRPNQDAVIYFAEEIFPRLRSKIRGVTLSVVGRSPPPDIRQLDRRDDIEITGTVEDVRPYYDQAAVCIVPLRIGGGSRLKILESFAMHCPVVSTSIGAEGLNVVDGKTLLIGDTPEQFADCVVRLIEGVSLAQALVDSGRELVEEEYGWGALAERLDEVLVHV